MDVVTVRPLVSPAELRPLEALQETIWGAPASEVVPVHQLVATVHTGGLVLGAFDGERLVGFAYAFPGLREALFLYSHMAGVVGAYRRLGVGRALKEAQRAWARDRGYDRIIWTFDPMREANAAFNLHALGAVGTRYLEDHYGPLDDGMNRGQPSDRVEVELATSGERPGSGDGQELRVQLSGEFGSAERSASRLLLQRAFAEGLVAVDFRDGGYVMRPPDQRQLELPGRDN